MFGNNKEQVPQDIYPIPHDRGSATNTMVASAAGEGLKGAGKGALGGAITGAVILGGLAFLALTPAGWGVLGAIGTTIGSAFGISSAAGGASISGAAVWTTVVVGIGATLGALKGLGIGGIIGGGLGIFKGGSDGHQKVQHERALAAQVQHELGGAAMETQAMMAQAQAMGHRNSASAYAGGLPPQGSPMNMASSQINAADIAEHGRLADMQMQRA